MPLVLSHYSFWKDSCGRSENNSTRAQPMVILNNFGWLDFSGYSAAAISLGLLMCFTGLTVPGRAFVLLPHVFLYYLIAVVGILLISHGLYCLHCERQQRQQRQRQEERLLESKVDYLKAATPESGLADLVNEDEELPEISFEQSLMEKENES